MARPLRILLPLLAVLLGFQVMQATVPDVRGGTAEWRYRLTEAEADADSARVLTPGLRRATFEFAPGTSVADARDFLDAIANTREDARRVVDLIDGLVTIRFGADEDGALGRATPGARYEVLIDLALTRRHVGERGIRQVAMHELGHVVDIALLTDPVRQVLDEQVPRGYDCPAGSQLSACAPRSERFAETFAKWATGDLGAGMYAGYAVLPPEVPFDVWGAPLSALARR